MAGAGCEDLRGPLGLDAARSLRLFGAWELFRLIEGRPRISGGRGGRLYRVASTKPVFGSE
ncbi:MAG: hypothetical protein KJN97_04540, partial [Deltaproteobacteria bacterium]|nr:hypothetical protein [Deltaproteobacteria bacterium]